MVLLAQELAFVRRDELAKRACEPGQDHTMTPDQVKAIQESFAKVVPISEQAAALFYGRLFEIAPAARPLFRGDLEEQGRKLMGMLGAVVNGLGNIETILPAASALAKRHVDYGVRQPITSQLERRCCGRWSAGSARNGSRSRGMDRSLHGPGRLHDRRSYGRRAAAE